MEEIKTRGRPSMFREEYAQQLLDFFNVEPYYERVIKDKAGTDKIQKVANKFPTLARFATVVGVTRETLHDWATATTEDGMLRFPEFSYAYKRAKDYQESILVEGTMNGVFNAPFAIFTAKNILGWRDKTEQEVTGKDGEPLLSAISVSFVKPQDA